MTILLAMAIFALVTSISPGPVNILATVTGANCGYLRTVPHIMGATLGFVTILFLLGFGLSQFLSEAPYLTDILTYLGGAFLLYLSYKVATQNPLSDSEEDNTSAPSLFQGIMCQWLNPKAWIVSLAGISVFFHDNSAELEKLLIFCSIFFVVCYASISVWAVLGVTIRSILSTPRHFKLFNIVMGLLLAVTVLYTFSLSN
ncbi:LysE family translocator [Vibrio mangrovi]|uniref:Cysteine/O-acetylserine efflux protein n=1 Tax=Vibrio mangrovi TaxID=474394 RepID=A0A1Y6ITK4_9VIBR|nr:LysE family translocator [Vibrio mangrovi]MDW6004674.1 LysE family translocator [Vibrio mangrovi]SMS00964.1 Cysteine/O-acetylserine efflux protein [Vibrio mangrovi]